MDVSVSVAENVSVSNSKVKVDHDSCMVTDIVFSQISYATEDIVRVELDLNILFHFSRTHSALNYFSYIQEILEN